MSEKVCGKPHDKTKYDIVAHHQDYDKPLDVNWLCNSCHRLIHSAVTELIAIAA